MIPEKELEKQELDVWSLQREAWIDDLMCSRIFDSLMNSSGHNCCGKLENDEAEEGEEEPVQCVDLESSRVNEHLKRFLRLLVFQHFF